jgi:DNA-directed RNA polymerase I, II, and III subunit RPABC1
MNIIKIVGINHGIIIYRDNATPVAKKMIQNNTNICLELFKEEELLYNITKHILVPIHEYLSESDTIEFKKKFGTKIPVILSTDVIARFYNFKKGSIIRIIRKDDYVVYRIVK